MKILKYNICTRINRGTEENPMWEDSLSPVEMDWNETNEEIAKAEAYNGEYQTEEVDVPEPTVPSGDESTVWDELDAAYQEGVDSV